VHLWLYVYTPLGPKRWHLVIEVSRREATSTCLDRCHSQKGGLMTYLQLDRAVTSLFTLVIAIALLAAIYMLATGVGLFGLIPW